jgi:hypothetical protein
VPQKRKRRLGTSSKKTRSAATRPSTKILPKATAPLRTAQRAPHWKQLTPAEQKQRVSAFEFLRLRRQGNTWQDAARLSRSSRNAAQRYFPRAFAKDEHGKLQVSLHDFYTRHVQVQTSVPGKFRLLRARGDRKATLVAIWNNAVKAAGRGDFSLIDQFPRGVFVDGFRLVTSHDAVTRIAKAGAESKNPFEDIYAVSGIR